MRNFIICVNHNMRLIELLHIRNGISLLNCKTWKMGHPVERYTANAIKLVILDNFIFFKCYPSWMFCVEMRKRAVYRVVKTFRMRTGLTEHSHMHSCIVRSQVHCLGLPKRVWDEWLMIARRFIDRLAFQCTTRGIQCMDRDDLQPHTLREKLVSFATILNLRSALSSSSFQIDTIFILLEVLNAHHSLWYDMPTTWCLNMYLKKSRANQISKFERRYSENDTFTVEVVKKVVRNDWVVCAIGYTNASMALELVFAK